MNKLKTRWQQKSLRERRLLTGMVALISLCFLYYAIWLPWQQQEEKWRNTLNREKNTLEWMRERAPQIQTQAAGVQPTEALSLSATLTQTSSAYGVDVTRLQPQGERLTVTLAPIEFNSLMQWIERLEQQHLVRIIGFDVTAQATKPGWVIVNRLIVTRNDAKQAIQLRNRTGLRRVGNQNNNEKNIQ